MLLSLEAALFPTQLSNKVILVKKPGEKFFHFPRILNTSWGVPSNQEFAKELKEQLGPYCFDFISLDQSPRIHLFYKHNDEKRWVGLHTGDCLPYSKEKNLIHLLPFSSKNIKVVGYCDPLGSPELPVEEYTLRLFEDLQQLGYLKKE
jgi:hypothetical protein